MRAFCPIHEWAIVIHLTEYWSLWNPKFWPPNLFGEILKTNVSSQDFPKAQCNNPSIEVYCCSSGSGVEDMLSFFMKWHFLGFALNVSVGTLTGGNGEWCCRARFGQSMVYWLKLGFESWDFLVHLLSYLLAHSLACFVIHFSILSISICIVELLSMYLVFSSPHSEVVLFISPLV